MKRYGLLIGALVCLAIITLVVARQWTQNNLNQKVAISIPETPEPTTAPREVPDDYVMVGGVMRPRTDVEESKRAAFSQPDEKPLFPNPGKTPLIDPNANAQTKSVQEALNNPTQLGHRLSAMIPAPKFDLAKYQTDPKSYLETVEPGRIWQSAKPGPGVAPLERTSNYFQKVIQGESVILEAKASPGMPVTFMSPRLGQFDNLLTTTTVAANDEGVAKANFKVTPGTRGEIEVFASSPVHSGRARFLIKVVLPDDAASSPNQ